MDTDLENQIVREMDIDLEVASRHIGNLCMADRDMVTIHIIIITIITMEGTISIVDGTGQLVQ